MALVNIDSLHRQVLQVLGRTEPPAGVELLSYKRNRSVAVIVLPGGRAIVRERGYQEQEMTVAGDELPKILKTMIKREFPRSRKVRLHKFAHPDELSAEHKTL